jgi:acetate CoA/acetoacetate CoA-transferase beta subunit
MGVMEVTEEGLLLTEVNSQFSVQDVQDATEATLLVSPELKQMSI